MDFGLSEEQIALKDSARAMLARECPTTEVRKMMASDDAFPRALHAEIAKLGWTGIIIPEKFGGAGLGMLDMAVVLEEAGYAAMPGPLMFSSVLAAGALKLGSNADACARWLPKIADGSAIGTIAIGEAGGGVEAADVTAIASREGTAYRISGIKPAVPYAGAADIIVVAARDGGRVGLYIVETKAAGVSIRAMKGLDLTRRIATVTLDRAPAQALDAPLDRVIDIGAIAVAADSLGGVERSLEMAVEYSKIREQFGKPIGSFQALKHAAAEIVSEVEPARALLWYAAYAFDNEMPDASKIAAMAKARLCEVYSRGSDRAVLMHGGIGFTWEHDMHLWFKRARFNESYFGAPAFHRERVAALSAY
jgi:alkylation response protein AidB-like acyl-CoA dehydrogenase